MRPEALGLALILATLALQGPSEACADPPPAPSPAAGAPGAATPSPEALELRLAEHPELQNEILEPLAAGLMAADAERREASARELEALSRARARRLTRGAGPGPWPRSAVSSACSSSIPTDSPPTPPFAGASPPCSRMASRPASHRTSGTGCSSS